MSKHFFSSDLVDRCFNASTSSRRCFLDTDPLVFGITVKGQNADRTIIWPVRGNNARLSWPHRTAINTQDPYTIISTMSKLYDGELGHSGYTHKRHLSVVIVDTTYPGERVVDMKPNCTLHPTNPIEPIQHPLFADIRSLLYHRLQENMEKCEINLPIDATLIDELKAITYTLREKDNKIVIDSKQKIKEKIERFPDLAETLALTQFYQPEWKS